MNEVTLNIYPILKFLQNILTLLGGFTLAGIIVFLFYNNKNIGTLVDWNKKMIDKFPLVSQDFFSKSAKEQNIENNQEIHEINQKIDEIEYFIQQLNIRQAMTLKGTIESDN